ncbi:hemagglutinin repeat-containing protein, partial [Cupriavidus sp. NPDC089707]|uniref:hemagglutinin repeat-containing protein n=1 Tax=Cupriavidus sp. NPDC089707 TaxID=3363963 RepID=UPI0037F47979
TQVVGNNIVNRGQIGGTGTTVVNAQQDVRNLDGRITGTDTLVSAGRDVINETQTISNQVTMGNHSAGATGVGSVAAITATNNVGVLAGRDINMAGGVVGAGNNALLGAGRDVNLGTVATGTTQDSSSRGGQSYYHDQTTVSVGSSVQARNNVVAVAGRDATLTGSAIDADGNASLVAGRNTTVTAAIDTHTHSEGSLGGKGAEYTKSSYDESVSGSSVHAGNKANLAAGQSATVNSVLQANGIAASTESNGTGNLAVLGSSVTTDNGAANLIATGDVTVGAVNEKHSADSWSQSRRSNGLSSEQTTKSSSQSQNIAVGSMVSADSVNGRAGRDLTVTGSSVGATGDVSLHADRNLTIGASESTSSSSSSQETRKSGLMSSGGASVTVGKQQTNQSESVQTTTHTGSLVGSVGGNVDLSAGQAYTQTGSTVTALQGDVGIQAKSVDINAATDTYRMDQETHFKQSGLTVAVSNPLIAATQTVGQMAEAQGKTDDPRMKALAGAAGGLAAKNAYDAVKGDPASAGGINISVTVGGSKSDSQQTQTATTAVGSKVSAGGDVRVRAEGGGQDSNINVVGSDIQSGNNMLLKADNQVNLQAAASTAEQHSSSQSVSGGVGIGISVGAKGTSFGVTANAAASRGNADGNDVTWTNSHATAGNTLVIDSGSDTNLKGAVASGKQVVANVGGDLNIESLQDTSTYRSKDQSIGGSLTVGAGFSGSANVGQQKINSDFASVGEQSAIRAGDGGYQIDVKGNTDLKGGIIAGGTADKNTLATDTLTVSDIHNHAEYSGSSVSIGAGFTAGGSGGKSTGEGSGVGLNQGGQATTGGDAVPGTTLPTTGGNGQGFSFAPPMVAGASGSADSTTASGVSAGAITIRNDARQKALTGKDGAETLAGLNRDTTNTGNSLTPIFNEQEIKAGFEIVGALQREAGVFLNNRTNEADAAKKAADAADKDPSASPEQRAALQQRADDLAKWGQGGTYRQVMTVLTAAASGNVTGSTAQFVQSAAVGYLQGMAANQVKQMADSLDSETARAALHAIVGCAGAAAASQSCSAGAMGAASASMLGSLLGPTEGMTPEQKQAREGMVQSMVAGVAGTTGMNPATATNAATFEIENNQLALPAPRPMPTPGTPQKPFQTPGKSADQNEATLTGSPDQSKDNQSKPLLPPVQDIVKGIQEAADPIFTPILEGANARLDSILTMAGGADKTDGARQSNPSKADSPVWQDLRSAGNGVKTDGKRYFEWDHTHNDIEVYNKRGEHLGSMNPVTGEMYKPAVPGRKLNNR